MNPLERRVISMNEQPTIESIHKMVSLRVLESVPVKPKNHSRLKWPLGFMTDSCKRTPETSDAYSSSESNVSKRILNWRANLPETIRKLILGIELELDLKSDEGFYPPLVIRAKSGLGKSVLMGKVIAELIDASFNNSESEWPSFDRIVYSQLKGCEPGENLETSICRGMDGFHKCNNFQQFFDKTVNCQNKIILIDSLDEHNERSEWWNKSKILSDNGWKVIWACRDPDWDHYDLGNEEEIGLPNYNRRDGNPTKHWNAFTEETWSLYLDNDRMDDVYSIAKNSIPEGQPGENKKKEYAKLSEYIDYCYSDTQLMHIFHTNSNVTIVTAKELEKNLINALLEARQTFLKKPMDDSSLDKPEFYEKFFNYNLAKLIIESSLTELNKLVKWKPEVVWKSLCRDFYNANSQSRQIGVLSEEIPLKSTYIDNNEEVLLKWLYLSGINRDFNFFRHRDFATVAYVEGAVNGLKDLESDISYKDVLFQHFFPLKAISKTSDSSDNFQKEVIYDFLRRTGNIIAQSSYLWDREEEHTHPIAMASARLLNSGVKGSDKSTSHQKALSKKQKEAIELNANNRAVILHGVPGSGKNIWRYRKNSLATAKPFRTKRRRGSSIDCGFNKAVSNKHKF